MILTINGGSSSIKFSLYSFEEPLEQLLIGGLENIGRKDAKLHFTDLRTHRQDSINMADGSREAAANFLLDWLQDQGYLVALRAIGHRLVHGMQHTAPERITPELLADLRKISAYDPEHLPAEIKLIELCGERCPDLLQIACFDTAFHASMPDVAKLLPIPRRYLSMGIHRYGFHGLSYAWLLEELERTAGTAAAKGRIILAHLGNGASLAAVKDGQSMDTSMGFTPTSGLPMGTRSGDLDPGVAWFLMQMEELDPQEFSHLINHESGLLGISETSADVRELLLEQGDDHRAAEAIELFCYQTKKWIGSFAAAMGGLDTLVFSGGIGENSGEIRSRICQGLEFLGITLDESKNVKNETFISTGRVAIHVIRTNEEGMIAKLVSLALSERSS